MTDGGILAEAAMMMLAPALGHERAHALVMAASRQSRAEGKGLAEVVAELPEAKAATAGPLQVLHDPSAYLGWSAELAIKLAANDEDDDG
jgi:3-carboxy-cis,cis-muconate cycloisomerase